MSQYARPASDIANDRWNYSEGSTLYGCIDEESASDTDYIYTDDSADGASCTIGLSEVTDPQSGSGHIVRWRWQSTRDSTPPEKGDVELYEGATLRATCAIAATLPTSWTDDSYTLDTTEADAISDYTALRLVFTADTLGNNESMQVSWAELEVPNAPGPGGAASNLMLLGVG